MSRFVDAIICYRILKKLSTPFEETDAYRLGIIDSHGKILRKFNDLNTNEEKDSYTLLDRLCWRIKRIIERQPFEKSKLASFAAALMLVKEHYDADHEPLPSEFESKFLTLDESRIDQSDLDIVEQYLDGYKTFRMHLEDMSVGGGFSGQATPDPNPNLAGRDILLGKKIQRRKKPNVK